MPQFRQHPHRARRLAAIVPAACLTAPVASLAQDNLLVDPGFEADPPLDGVITPGAGIWFGDWSDTTGPERGIEPLDGLAMLRFDGTAPGGGSGSGTGSEIFQLVDVSDRAALIDAGLAAVTADVYFNRVAGDASTDDGSVISVYALSSVPATASDGIRQATNAVDERGIIDPDEATWEPLEAVMRLPAGTRYVLYRVVAVENKSPSATMEFEGHYADSATAGVLEVPRCIADINIDARLDLFDFLGFQNLFDAGDLAADFDGDGSLTLFDFLAFQNAFDAGCP